MSRHLNALYDVLLRVSEASRVSGTDDQAAQLQQALLSLGNARLALDDRMQGSAGALEKQVIDLRATIQQQAAERAAMPTPVAVPWAAPGEKGCSEEEAGGQACNDDALENARCNDAHRQPLRPDAR